MDEGAVWALVLKAQRTIEYRANEQFNNWKMEREKRLKEASMKAMQIEKMREAGEQSYVMQRNAHNFDMALLIADSRSEEKQMEAAAEAARHAMKHRQMLHTFQQDEAKLKAASELQLTKHRDQHAIRQQELLKADERFKREMAQGDKKLDIGEQQRKAEMESGQAENTAWRSYKEQKETKKFNQEFGKIETLNL